MIVVDESDVQRIAKAVHNDIGPLLAEAVRAGAISAAEHIAKDSAFMDEYWKRGYDTLLNHGREDVQKSLGKRILTWLAGAAFGVGIYLATKSGLLK